MGNVNERKMCGPAPEVSPWDLYFSGKTTDPNQQVSPKGGILASFDRGLATSNIGDKPPITIPPSGDAFVDLGQLNACVGCKPEQFITPIEPWADAYFPGTSVYTSLEDGVIQINMPQEQLALIQRVAANSNIAPHKLNDVIYHIYKGAIFNKETGTVMTPEEIREWGYEKLFEGDAKGKIEDAIQNNPHMKEWYLANREKIEDNFKNNFKAYAGMYTLSIVSLMGMGELADVIGIEEPNVRLAFVLGPLNSVSRVSAYTVGGLKSGLKIRINGYRAASMFVPAVLARPFASIGFEFPAEAAKVAPQKFFGEAVPVRHNLVSIKFNLKGTGAKTFFKGLASSFFPAGETTMIRAGRSFVGVVKFPVHTFNMFVNMGCGIVTQKIWEASLGKFIPERFAWGLPKHFMELTALMAPHIIESMLPQAIRPGFSSVVNHAAFKILGYGLALDLAAFAAVGVTGLLTEESTMYSISVYMRSANNLAPVLDHLPNGIPFKMFLTVLAGGLNRMGQEKVEAVDGLWSMGLREGIRLGILKVIDSKRSLEEWIDFAGAGGFASINTYFLKTVGSAKKEIKDFDKIISQLKPMYGLKGKPENRLFEDCIDFDWFKGLERGEITKALTSGEFDDETFVKAECMERFSIWVLTGKDYQCADDDKQCLEAPKNMAITEAKKRGLERFADFWVTEEMSFLETLYYKDDATKRLEILYQDLKSNNVEPYIRLGSHWDKARVNIQQLKNQWKEDENLKKSFARPAIVESLSHELNRSIIRLEGQEGELVETFCLQILLLEELLSKNSINRMNPETMKKEQESISKLPRIELYIYGPDGRILENNWRHGAYYLDALGRYSAANQTQLSHFAHGAMAYMEERIEDYYEGQQEINLAKMAQAVNRLRVLYPELVTRVKEVEDAGGAESPVALVSIQILKKKSKEIIDRTGDVPVSVVTHGALSNKYKSLEAEVVAAFHDVMKQRLLLDAGDYSKVWDGIWNDYETGKVLKDIKYRLNCMENIIAIDDIESEITQKKLSGLSLKKEAVWKRVMERLPASYSAMKTLKMAPDLAALEILEKNRWLARDIGKLSVAAVQAKPSEDPEKVFFTLWKNIYSVAGYAASKRQINEIISDGLYLVGEEYKTRGFDPSRLETRISGYGSKKKIFSDVRAVRDYLFGQLHTPYVHLIARLMGASSDCPTSDSLWHQNSVGSYERVKEEFDRFTEDSKKDVPDIYFAEDYSGSLKSQNSASNVALVDTSDDAQAKARLTLLRFKIAWRIAELKREGILNERRYWEAHQAIIDINKIEMSDDLTNAKERVEKVLKDYKKVVAPIMVEVFNIDGSLKTTDYNKLLEYAGSVDEQ